MSFFDLYVSVIDDVIVNLLRLIRRHVRVIRVGPFEFDIHRDFGRSHADTLTKIQRAQDHLSEAVSALDRLRDDFAAEKARLDRLALETNAKKLEHQRALAELETTRDLLQKDKDVLQRVIGTDNLRRGRITGFISGVLASVVAAALWFLLPKAWHAISAWLAARGK